MNAEILSVGTELLLGGTVNTDARDISLALAELGVNVYWHTVVGDNPARLTECLYRARNRADLIITTGGLGPTCDDLTKQTLARAFDRKLYLNEDALADIREYFAERGRSFTDNNLQQAYLPEGSIMLPNDCGTAPGCIIEDGPVRVVMLPGPPRECVTMLRNYVMPYLQKLSGAVIRSHMIRFFGIGESAMETRLRSFMDGANPTVAPYSREGECWVRVTAKGANEQECEALMEPVIEDICDKMGDLVYGIDCASLEERVRKALGSDIGIGITGWAGPDGDDVGLVFVALASRSGCFVRRLQCGHAPRPRIRLIAASNALDMIRRYLTGLDV